MRADRAAVAAAPSACSTEAAANCADLANVATDMTTGATPPMPAARARTPYDRPNPKTATAIGTTATAPSRKPRSPEVSAIRRCYRRPLVPCWRHEGSVQLPGASGRARPSRPVRAARSPALRDRGQAAPVPAAAAPVRLDGLLGADDHPAGPRALPAVRRGGPIRRQAAPGQGPEVHLADRRHHLPHGARSAPVPLPPRVDALVPARAARQAVCRGDRVRPVRAPELPPAHRDGGRRRRGAHPPDDCVTAPTVPIALWSRTPK